MSIRECGKSISWGGDEGGNCEKSNGEGSWWAALSVVAAAAANEVSKTEESKNAKASVSSRIVFVVDIKCCDCPIIMGGS